MLRVADDPDVGFTEAVLATDGRRVACTVLAAMPL